MTETEVTPTLEMVLKNSPPDTKIHVRITPPVPEEMKLHVELRYSGEISPLIDYLEKTLKISSYIVANGSVVANLTVAQASKIRDTGIAGKMTSDFDYGHYS